MTFLRTITAAAIASATATTAAFAQCVTLAAHIGPGPFFGTTIKVDENTRLQLVPMKFWWDPGTPASGQLRARMVGNPCFGGPMSMNLNNTNLVVNILQQEPNVKVANINYCDFGGFENVSSTVTSPPEYVGEIDMVGSPQTEPFGGAVNVSVSEQPIPGGVEGKLIFEPRERPLQVMVAGGQEFFVHTVCLN